MLFSEFRDEIEKAISIRALESILLELFSQGLLNGTVHTCVGQEIIGVVVSKYLEEDDFVVSNHRGHGHYLARTGDERGLLAEVMGRTTGCAGGVGGSQHLIHKNYLSNGIQGGMAPIAAGIALSNQAKGRNAVSVVYMGDGTLGQGVVYETFNICANWDLPVVFIVEDNQYAQSTSSKQSFSGSLRERAEGFGLSYFTAQSNELAEFDSVAQAAIGHAREKSKPVLLHVQTYRLNSHSKGDDNREPQEIESRAQSDLLNRFKEDEPELFNQIYTDTHTKLMALVESVKGDPKLESSTSLEDLPFIYREAANWEPIEPATTPSSRINEEIFNALKEVFEDYDSFMVGEDIEYITEHTGTPYGGAFKVSKNLSELFKGRVRNTPISEAAIVGVGTGLALCGHRSFVEIMFGDFTTLIVDQVQQHAAKFKKMYAGKVTAPVVIRTPMGGGRGYGPTHSQSIESIFYSILGLRMVALNRYTRPADIYRSIAEQVQEPTLLIENKTLYTEKRIDEQTVFGYLTQVSSESFPQVKISPVSQEPSVTIVCYGGVASSIERVLDTLSKKDIFAEVIIPSSLKPLNIYEIERSVKCTERLVLAEEGNKFGGVLTSITAELCERKVNFELATCYSKTILSCAIDAEMDSLVDASDISDACMRMCSNAR